MKNILFSVLAFSLLAFSCNKVVAPEESFELPVKTISGVIDNEGAKFKSTYTDEGVFSWVYGDEIAYILYHTTNHTYDNGTLATNDATGSLNATFTGATTFDGYTEVDLAFYPQIRKSGTYVVNDQKFTNNSLSVVKGVPTLQAKLGQPVEAYSDRLKGIIPMIGKKTGTDATNTVDKYHFSPVTGVLKVAFKGLPSTAKQIRLDMPDDNTYALNGVFSIDTSRSPLEIKEEDCVGTKWGQKYMNFDYVGESDEFYFPIPTGTIPAGKLTVSVHDGTNTLYAVTNKQDIVLTRGEITELPEITVPSLKVKLSGTADSPKATFYFSGDIAKVKCGNNMTNSGVLGGMYFEVATSGTERNLRHDYNYRFPLYYQGYDSDGNAVGSIQRIDYWAVSSDGVTDLCKQFTSASSDIGLTGDKIPEYTAGTIGGEAPTITFEVSDDITKGNVMITEFCGVAGKAYATYENYTFDEAGNKTPDKGAPQIATETVNYETSTPYCVIDGKKYFFVEYNKYYDTFKMFSRFGVKSTSPSLSPTAYGKDIDFACWGEICGLYDNEHSEWGTQVKYFIDVAE